MAVTERTVVIVVTGEIGAGKSTVSKILARLMGCAVIDADVIAAEMWSRPDVKSMAVSHWGNDILDAQGNIIKAEISQHIFADNEEHKFCNSMIHPLVMEEIRRRTENIDAVAEIPLLPEAGRPEWIDRAVYVEADFEVRAERCKSRGWSVEELRRREKFLLPKEQRMAVCDYIIRNEGSLSDLERQAVNFVQILGAAPYLL